MFSGSMSSGNLNDIATNSLYILYNGTYTNAPVSVVSGFLSTRARTDGTFIKQEYVGYASGEMYVREKWNGTWYEWHRVDNFGCNTPSELASLLGGYSVRRFSQSYDSNKDTITLTWVPDNNLQTHYGIIVMLNRPNAADCHQVFMFNGYGESADGRTEGTKIIGTAGSFSFASNKIILTGSSWRRVDVLQIGGDPGTWNISAT